MNQQESKEIQQAEAAAHNHMQRFVSKIMFAMHEFLKPIDYNESEDTKKYIREVVEEVNNLVLTITMTKDDHEYVEILKASTEQYLKNLEESHKEAK